MEGFFSSSAAAPANGTTLVLIFFCLGLFFLCLGLQFSR